MDEWMEGGLVDRLSVREGKGEARNGKIWYREKRRREEMEDGTLKDER